MLGCNERKLRLVASAQASIARVVDRAYLFASSSLIESSARVKSGRSATAAR